MKNIITNALVILGLILLVGCGTTNTTKTTFYNADGTINRVVEETAKNSDFSKLVDSGEGKATNVQGDFSKFYIGWNSYGINFLSASISRTTAPAKESESNNVLEQMAKVVKSSKASIEIGEDVKVNK
jgi:hypothetical protein